MSTELNQLTAPTSLPIGRSRTNIAHILPWPTVGGVECATLRIAQGVEGDEFKSIAFVIPEAEKVKRFFGEQGFETVTFKDVEPSYRRPNQFLRNSFLMARQLKRKNINLIHCSDLPASIYAGLAGRIAGIPVLCHVRNRHSEFLTRDKSFLHAVNHFAFVSRDSWKRFGYKVSERHGTVVYDGLDIPDPVARDSKFSLLKKYNIPAGTKVIGMVARVAVQKDYPTLIRAAARIVAEEKNVRFLIVGDHSGTENYRKHYEEVQLLLAETNLSPYFIFTDFQSDVVSFIDCMDIFVLSTHWEGLPLVILEAMAQRKPVIATAVDGIPEIVVPGKTGLLHMHEDDGQLAENILSLVRDEELAARLGDAGRQALETDWSNERFVRDIKNMYRKILVGRKV